jgi:glycosyltransferase involved in cell wall biosynthesis
VLESLKSASEVSVLIPLHGDGRYIESALHSVLIQRGVTFEILIILDRPTDLCLKALEKYDSYPEIRLLESKNPGISNALNLGLLHARYEFIARLDSDDMMADDRLAIQSHILAEEPDLIVVGSNIELIDSEGAPIGETKFPKEPKDVANLLRFRNCIAHPAVMMKKSSIEKVGGYRTSFEPAEDYDLWLRLSRFKPLSFQNIPLNLTFYRVHMNQISTQMRSQQIYLSRAMAKQFRCDKHAYETSDTSANFNSSIKLRIDVFLLARFKAEKGGLLKKYFAILCFSFLNPREVLLFMRGNLNW